MGKGLTSYLDLAENDYRFFRNAYDNNLKGGTLARTVTYQICKDLDERE